MKTCPPFSSANKKSKSFIIILGLSKAARSARHVVQRRGNSGISMQRYNNLGIFNRVECWKNIYIAKYVKNEPNKANSSLFFHTSLKNAQ